MMTGVLGSGRAADNNRRLLDPDLQILMAGRTEVPMGRALLVYAAAALVVTDTPKSWCEEPSVAANVHSSMPCAGDYYRQFDFWIGDWDVFDVERPTVVVAHARVESILNGCVLHEVYEGLDGHKGESFSIYDVTRDTWHQTWVND